MCDSCEKREKKYFWRMEAGQGKACLACHDLKKSCVAGGAEELEMEASLSKKRRVEGKGKAKAKVGTSVSRVADSVAVDVLRDIVKELKGLHVEVGDLCVFAQCTVTMTESSWRTQRQTNICISELKDHFMPEENDREGSGAENREAHDVEMGENGADMADDAMDETFH